MKMAQEELKETNEWLSRLGEYPLNLLNAIYGSTDDKRIAKNDMLTETLENLFFRVKKEDFAERYCISETTKEVVICLFKQRLTIKQTADNLKISVDDVDMHLSKALRYFRNPMRSKQLNWCFEEIRDTVNSAE